MLKAKGQFDMSYWLLPYIVLLQYEKIFKIFARLFVLSSCLEKKDNNIMYQLTSNQASTIFIHL